MLSIEKSESIADKLIRTLPISGLPNSNKPLADSLPAVSQFVLPASDAEFRGWARRRKRKTAGGGLNLRPPCHLSDAGQLTRVPRGFDEFKDGPLEEAFRMKSFIVEEPVADAVVASPKLADALVAFVGRAMPLLKFGWAALE